MAGVHFAPLQLSNSRAMLQDRLLLPAYTGSHCLEREKQVSAPTERFQKPELPFQNRYPAVAGRLTELPG